uniref:BTB/POZ domain-containing protein n=1 Tax=Panagrolaimus sp. PS1159 TaxID=55785 RepID=A0AC35FBM2_9BILA
MNEYPINLEWTIAEELLWALKNSINNEYLESEKFTAFNVSDVKYFLRIYPNGISDERRGKTCVPLYLDLGNEKKVQSEFTLSIKSANWSQMLNYVFEGLNGWGTSCCTTDDLFDANKKFIVNGKLTLKLEGILKIPRIDSEIKMKNLRAKFKMERKFYDLWNIGFEDFTIVSADGKELKVHKCVLAAQSPVFAAMLKPHTKESMDGKVKIPDFTFEIIEKSIKFCYHPNLLPDISPDDAIGIYRFADKYDIETVLHDVEFYFDKYDIENVRDYVELSLIKKLTVMNFCETVNAAISMNAMKLKNMCSDFLIDCISKKIDVPKIEEIDAEFIAEVQKSFLCQSFETL